ncbi:MAG TPA: Do family serine endopeptidase [Deltaproteobacteria bacterium]|nr:Do family serine endopeptidase [Deltaproteobacteria bacterium]HQB39340.1 Do family serine endopeptidase [Deltaproteobacteria bacterium]
MFKHSFCFIRLLVGILLLGVLSSCGSKGDAPLFFESKRKSGESDAPVKDVPADIVSTQKAFSTVAKKVTPSVVNISTISKKKPARPFFEMHPFFDGLFGDQQTRRDKSLGSGFIISRDGYIVTNDHVVRDAESIQVKLSNDKVYSARIVGSDRKTDIAVIKINADELPVAVLGDSDKLEVGQWAIAIGNPFGLDRTMTVGVVSATGRSNMGIEIYENFIQTDASINPGNSGGPLLNIYGEVIGINTAIVASGQGIGFAIPVNMAKPIFTQLITKGSVSRGWLGVTIQPVTEELAQSFGMKQVKGVLINGVMKGGPADKAGVRQGDVVTHLAGTEVKDPAHLQRLVAEAGVGKPVDIKVYREGRAVDLAVSLQRAEDAPQSGMRSVERGKQPGQLDALGIVADNAEGGGVVVVALARGGAAAVAGLQPGDIILSINRKNIKAVADYHRIVSQSGGILTMLIRRGEATYYFTVRPDK